MIIETIFDLLKAVILALIDTMPSFSIAYQQVGAIAGLIELFAYSSYFIPYSSLFICLGVGVAFYSAKFAMSVINWIIGKIPTID